MSITESEIQSRILRALGSHPDIRAFRNTVGEGWTGRTVEHSVGRVVIAFPKRVTFGLAVGSGDLIGFRSYEVQPDDVGRRIAVFMSVEVKTPKGGVRENQDIWRRVVEGRGGIAIVARSVDEAMRGVMGWKPEGGAGQAG